MGNLCCAPLGPYRRHRDDDIPLVWFNRHVLSIERSSIGWSCDDGATVGVLVVATVRLCHNNRSPYELQPDDDLRFSVTHCENQQLPVVFVLEPTITSLVGHSSVQVSFTPRVAGTYAVGVVVGGAQEGILGSRRTFVAGPLDASQTTFVDPRKVVIVTEGVYHRMVMLPKDAFGNFARIAADKVIVEVRKGSASSSLENVESLIEPLPSAEYEILWKIETGGHYLGTVLYEGQAIGVPNFEVICLNEKETCQLERNIASRVTCYKATLLDGKQKEMFMYISPRKIQLCQKFLNIPVQRWACRVCPLTKVVFHAEPGVFSLDDGYQPRIALTSSCRELIGATFVRFVLNNSGGSESFVKKRDFFYNNLQQHHSGRGSAAVTIVVSRERLIPSAMAATKILLDSDWSRPFAIHFAGEEGMDAGGVSREFFDLLTGECFDPMHGLFRKFDDSPQGLVHPSSRRYRPPNLDLAHYRFAGRIVGKCIVESAFGKPLVAKARFTRSFLVQLMGLKATTQLLETDDPALYDSITTHDITGLDLVFADEERDKTTGKVTVVPLKKGGEGLAVTEGSKSEYLTLLAEYRLVTSVKKEVKAFLEGLHKLVPSQLLAIFDEKELELLMCGVETVTYEELRRHASVDNGDSKWQEVVAWLWAALQGFSAEEMARFLQFVTGCSRLPPGGFQDLSQPVRIVPQYSGSHGRLPTAATCFNRLYLSTYDSYQHFHGALVTAITEGSQGFGLA
eukprot:Em0019g946a